MGTVDCLKGLAAGGERKLVAPGVAGDGLFLLFVKDNMSWLPGDKIYLFPGRWGVRR